MTSICPAGHASSTDDVCDECGVPIDIATETLPKAEADTTSSTQALTDGAAEPAARDGADQSSSADPHDVEVAANRVAVGEGEPEASPVPGSAVDPTSAEAPPSVGPAWEAVAVVDRAYYERTAAQGVAFPQERRERTFALVGHEVRIGRRSPARGISPEIDLSGQPEDPGISHLHARLVLQPEGTYSLVDAGSTNGTTVNDDPRPLAKDAPVPLRDGDAFHLGAWTTITLHARPDH